MRSTKESARNFGRWSTCRLREVQSLAHDFGQIASKLVRLYTPEEKDRSTKVKIAGDVCCKVLCAGLKLTN